MITNNHVVAEAADKDGPIRVIDQAGVEHTAELIGSSGVSDLRVVSPGVYRTTEPMPSGAFSTTIFQRSSIKRTRES